MDAVLWDVPRSNMHAVSDIGALVDWLQENISLGTESKDNLAVLHNQNDMVCFSGMSAWVTQSDQKVISRSVTSCAGMTAYMVVVGQTRVGFLSGGRGQKFRDLPMAERLTVTVTSPQCLRHFWAFGHERVHGCSHGKAYMELGIAGKAESACISANQNSPIAQLMRNFLIVFVALRRLTNLTLPWPWLKVSLTPSSNVTSFVDYILVIVDLWRPLYVSKISLQSRPRRPPAGAMEPAPALRQVFVGGRLTLTCCRPIWRATFSPDPDMPPITCIHNFGAGAWHSTRHFSIGCSYQFGMLLPIPQRGDMAQSWRQRAPAAIYITVMEGTRILSILSNHVSASNLLGQITVIWVFSARHPNQAAAAFCRKTPPRIPSLSVPNWFVMSSTGRSIQSTFSFPTRVGMSPFESICPF